MPLTRSTRSAVLLLIATFVLGAAAGVAGTALFASNDQGGRHRPDPERYQKRLTQELKLNAMQQDSVRSILKSHKASVDSAWADAGNRIETLRTVIRSEISQQLTPDQQRKYALMNQRNDSLRRQAEK